VCASTAWRMCATSKWCRCHRSPTLMWAKCKRCTHSQPCVRSKQMLIVRMLVRHSLIQCTKCESKDGSVLTSCLTSARRANVDGGPSNPNLCAQRQSCEQ
jgi:hypothetical protein